MAAEPRLRSPSGVGGSTGHARGVIRFRQGPGGHNRLRARPRADSGPGPGRPGTWNHGASSSRSRKPSSVASRCRRHPGPGSRGGPPGGTREASLDCSALPAQATRTPILARTVLHASIRPTKKPPGGLAGADQFPHPGITPYPCPCPCPRPSPCPCPCPCPFPVHVRAPARVPVPTPASPSGVATVHSCLDSPLTDIDLPDPASPGGSIPQPGANPCGSHPRTGPNPSMGSALRVQARTAKPVSAFLATGSPFPMQGSPFPARTKSLRALRRCLI